MKEKTKKTAKINVGGRPTTLTEALAELIVADVRKYLSLAHAAEANGIPRSTLATWMSHGNKDYENGIDTIFSKFTKSIKSARAEFVHDSIHIINTGDKNWQSNAWLLERCCAEDFGKDSELYKQLLEDYKMLIQSLVDQNKGVNHAG